jgi:hypothetical protein
MTMRLQTRCSSSPAGPAKRHGGPLGGAPVHLHWWMSLHLYPSCLAARDYQQCNPGKSSPLARNPAAPSPQPGLVV